MATHTITKLPKSEVKIEFEVTWDEAKPYLDEAVRDLTQSKPIPGFRPGKASYEDAKRHYGEMKILETAIERIIRSTYVKTVLAEQLETIGAPSIEVGQLVPGQVIKFTTTSSLLPGITTFPDFAKCAVKTKKVAVGDEQVNQAIEEMRRMRRAEALVDRPATNDDLVIIDLEMKNEGVSVEGGSGQDFRVYLSEPQYIPGLAKELEGIKANEERRFKLPFPADHFQKQLAGKEIDFYAKAKGIYALTLPEADDHFAKGVGLESIKLLREKLAENLRSEEEAKVKEAVEIEMLEKLTDATAYSEIPEILVNEEVRRMIHELQHGVEEQGMKWPDYLSSIKKTPDDLKLDFIPQALRRIKTAVLIKELAKKENIKPTDEEIDAEVDRILTQVPPKDSETRERVSSPDYRDYVASLMRNRKVLEWLKQQCVS